MLWELGLPLLIMLVTAIVMALIFFGAQSLLFKPRVDEGIDNGSEKSAH